MPLDLESLPYPQTRTSSLPYILVVIRSPASGRDRLVNRNQACVVRGACKGAIPSRPTRIQLAGSLPHPPCLPCLLLRDPAACAAPGTRDDDVLGCLQSCWAAPKTARAGATCPSWSGCDGSTRTSTSTGSDYQMPTSPYVCTCIYEYSYPSPAQGRHLQVCVKRLLPGSRCTLCSA